MFLPNAEDAQLDIEKLRDYCLNTKHPLGKHKAKVFELKLGIRSENALELKRQILLNIKFTEVQLQEKDIYGQRYFGDMKIDFKEKSAMIRTCWIVKTNEIIPRLISCYVL